MPKKTTRKRLSSADRSRILAEAESRGWTAQQVAKRYGISAWTYYGWRKRGAGKATRGTKTRGVQGRAAGGATLSANALRTEIRAALPGILREELGNALMNIVGRGTVRRRRRTGKK